ncbi:MAG: hypothetical protein ACOCX2_08940 [Armatimonadota bacterium]
MLLDHAGERVSPFTVAAAQADGANTLVTLEEDPGMTWDAGASASTFVYVPHDTYEGPHVLRLRPVAHDGAQ